ncbi:MAG: hypothetical protein GY953_43855, partial [bacterium]|nr:hypothetical protein [bacterium]
MNRKQSLPSAVALCCALATATPSTGQQRVPEKLRIGTWNLEHFGHRTVYGTNELNPRTADDIAKIADYIRQLEVDVLAVQEIADPAALRQLCELIGDDWDCVVGTTGGFSGGNGRISPGFLWNGATVELLQAEDLMQLPRNRDGVSIFHRVPVSAVFRARPDGLDFRAVTVHFKAGRGTKNERKRSAETATLLEWIHALQSRS